MQQIYMDQHPWNYNPQLRGWVAADIKASTKNIFSSTGNCLRNLSSSIINIVLFFGSIVTRILNYLLSCFVSEMVTFADLPCDILWAIIDFKASDVKRDPSTWKRYLHLLAICRSWRATALPIIYAYAFIQLPQSVNRYGTSIKEFKQSTYPGPYTNCQLIYDNGYGHLAKQLYILDYSKCWTPFPWLYLADVLGIRNSECPRIPAVRAWLCNYTQYKRNVANYNLSRANSLGPIANVIARKFPNVSSIGLVSHQGRGNHISVFRKLVSTYASQITAASINVREGIPEFLMATNICNLELDTRYITTIAPFINPEPLVCLKMIGGQYFFSWDCFKSNNSPRSIVFPNLRNLELLNRSMAKNWHKSKLSFPNLTHLRIHNVDISTEDAQCLTPPTLKSLEFTGTIDSALNLCRLNISGLNWLSLGHSLLECDRDRSGLAIKINELFGLAHSITTVCAELSFNYTMDFTNIYWPNITRLNVSLNSNPCNILDSIDKMPNLICLYIKAICAFHFIGDSSFSSFDTDLKNLKTLAIRGTSQLKMKMLYICWIFNHYTYGNRVEMVHLGHNRNVVLNNSIIESSLRVYFPNLKNIELRQIITERSG